MQQKITLRKLTNSIFKNVMITGILLLILGIVAIVYPEGFGKISAVTIGVFMVIGGVLRLTFAIVSISMGSMLVRYLYGLLMIIGGVYIVMNPVMGLEALTILMAVYFIIDGFTEVIYSFSLMPIGGGMFLLFSGFIGIVLGVLIFSKWPESSSYAIGIYLGIKLIVDGLMLTLTGNAVKKAAQLN